MEVGAGVGARVGAGAVVGVGVGAAVGRIARKVIAREYVAYFMHDRNLATNNTFTYGKRLYQEWVVDQYSQWIITHQILYLEA